MGSVDVSITTLKGVLRVTPSFVFEDARGRNLETYNKRLLREASVRDASDADIEFIQDSHSVSTRGVLRGIHGDDVTWKLLSCPFGRVYVVVVNHDPSSAQFRKWEGFVLSDRNRQQLLVPPKFGNGHLVLSEEAIFAYKLSAYTDTERQFTISWNDPELAIEWPIKDPLLSARDRR